MMTAENLVAETWILGDLLEGILETPLPERWRGCQVTDIYDDSRLVRPNGIFVALRGSTTDGRKYISEACGRGATILIGEGLDPLADRLVLNVPDARRMLALLAARWYRLEGLTAERTQLLAVTGTNGKTTAAYMTQAILRAAGRRCGMLGTVRYDLCGETMSARMTTPGPLDLARYVRQCVDNGASAVVMEVSSHALDQHRIDGLQFAAAAFTNLTQDHLDYHHSMEAYLAAKARLFRQLPPAASAVVNADDPSTPAILQDCRAQVVTFGLTQPAEITATIQRESIAETRYSLRLGDRELNISSPLVGKHNVYNAMTAAGLALAAGVPHETIEQGLNGLRNVPGRLHRVPSLPDIEVFVDYAHTPDALVKVLGVLKPLTRKRLIVVFGCGGNRDREKRPLMARAVGERADAIIVTSDNPRMEDPRGIIEEILPGFDESARRRVLIEPDRRYAIHAAIAGAAPGDVVLIAGKGHEDYQIIGTERRPFDDLEVALEALSNKAGKGDG